MSVVRPCPAGEPHPLASYDYPLPPELIAQAPARRRVGARLMLLPPEGAPVHGRIPSLIAWLRPGDLLVLNDTRVVPARLWARKPSGGRVEILLLRPAQPLRVEPGGREVHAALLKSHRRLVPGDRLELVGSEGVCAQIVARGERGQATLSLPGSGLALAARLGQTPLPPYIKRPGGPGEDDARRYQTVYAAHPGAVAAPTAGLHFSPELLAALARRGVERTALTLHVGYGTFAEPSLADLAAGRLHAEWVEIGEEAAAAVARTRARGGRVIPVGTTSLRSLEWRGTPEGGVVPGAGWCDLLIAEGYRFKVADGLFTNFHLPRTTLIMLVAALAGRERVLAAYAEAVRERYRFYSFGDAMLVLPGGAACRTR